MKHKTRILTLRTLSVLVLVALLAALSPPSLNSGGVALAQSGPALAAASTGPTSIQVNWDSVTGANSYRLIRWTSGQTNWTDVGGTHTLTSYDDTGLTTGSRYYYRVTAVTDGTEGPWSESASAVPGSLGVPTLTVTAGMAQLDLSWTPVTGAAHYNVIHWTTGMTDWENIGGNITGTSHPHTGLTGGTTHFYQVRAVNAANTRSDWSNRVSETVLQRGAPSVPTSFAAASGNRDITLTWAAPASDGGSTITRYEYRYRQSGGTFPDSWTSVGLALTVNVAGLTNGQEYDFEVRAVNAEGDGEAATGSGTPATVPLAPSLSASGEYRAIRLSWSAPTDDGGSDVTGYRLEIYRNGAYVLESNLGATATTYRDAGLSDDTAYDYQLFAINAAGDSPASTATATTLATAPTAPSPPLALTPPEGGSVAGAGKVTLDWNPPGFNAQTITRYEYRYAKAADDFTNSWRTTGSDPAITMFEVTGLTPGQEYKFQVRAVNSAGVSDPLLLPPATPTNTAPTVAPNMVVEHASPRTDGNAQNRLTWNALDSKVDGDGDPDGTNIIASYMVHWKSDRSAGTTDTSDWPADDATDADDQVISVLANTESAGKFEILHSQINAGAALLPGTVYDYRVRAVNPVGGGDWSTVRSLKTAVLPPAAPTLLASDNTNTADPWVIDVNAITIKWTAPTDTMGGTITGYEIWVGLTTVTVADEIAALKPVVTGRPASPTSFKNDGLLANTAYFFRVRAVNSAGGGTWSNEVTATTGQAAAGAPVSPGGDTPTPPGLTEGTGDDAGQITVTWGAFDPGGSPILRYEVQWRQEANATDAAVTEADESDVWDDATIVVPDPPVAPTYVHTGLPGGVFYVYRVRAVNGIGPSNWSGQASEEMEDRVPDAPKLEATSNGKTEILLEWTVPASNGMPITDYDVQRWDPAADTGSGDWIVTDQVDGNPDTDDAQEDSTATLLVDTGLTPGTTYYYRIRAANSVGESTTDWAADNARGDAASATTDNDVPARMAWADLDTDTAGTNPSVGTGDNSNTITLGWTAPADGGLDITRYEIRVWDGAQWVHEAYPAAADTDYEDTGLEHGTIYNYVIRAENSLGWSPTWSPSIMATTRAAAPDVPVLTATASGRDTVILEWTVPANNGSPITDYELQRWTEDLNDNGTADDPGWATADLLGTDASTATLHTDTGLASGTTFYYRIRATNGANDGDDATTGDGVGDWSASNESKQGAASATTAKAVPAAPTLTTPVDAADIEATSITVRWTAPTDTGGSALTGYELQVWDGALRRWVGVTSPAKDADSYEDTGLNPGGTYYYRLRAMNAQGAGDWAAFVSATTDARAPGIPTLVATAISTTEIRLTWSVADDGGSPITDYDLFKWDYDPNDDGDTEDADWGDTDLLGTDASTATFHIDTVGNGPGTLQHFRIRAANSIDTTETEGEWTTAVSVQTIAGVPDRPILTATTVSSSQIQLSWRAPSANGSPISHYELEVWDKANKEWDRIGGDLEGPDLRYAHSNLEADTTYTYRIRAVNGAPGNNGEGQWSTLKFTKTNN